MATLKTIRKRIVSVKNTQKITKAMKMVAAAKLRRAQQALTNARPHARLLEQSLGRLVPAAGAWKHPLLRVVESPKKAAVLVLTSDRGLCGGFNGNLLRKVEDFLRHEATQYESVEVSVIGRKGRDYFRAKKRELKEVESLNAEEFDFSKAQSLAQVWRSRYQSGEFDHLYIAYNSFQSAISQVPTVTRVLPLQVVEESFSEEDSIPKELRYGRPLIWGGESQTILNGMLERQLTTVFYLAILESLASELGARMSAMENATNNASEMMATLTLQYNRARQAAITLELMDIVNGAESLSA